MVSKSVRAMKSSVETGVSERSEAKSVAVRMNDAVSLFIYLYEGDVLCVCRWML